MFKKFVAIVVSFLLVSPAAAQTKITTQGTNFGPASGQWYQDLGSHIVRVPDRLFVGYMASNPATQASPSADWLDVYTSSKQGDASNTPAAISTLASLTTSSNRSGAGIVGGAQTNQINYNAAVLATAGYCVSNNSTYQVGCFGGYFEADLNSTVAGSYVNGIEVDVANYGSSFAAPNPYTGDTVIAIRAACGSGYTYSAASQSNCGVAFNIGANPKLFQGGINFSNGSLTTQTDGFANAINYYQGLATRQFNSLGQIVGFDIYNNATLGSGVGTLRSDTNGFCIVNASLGGLLCTNASGVTTGFGNWTTSGSIVSTGAGGIGFNTGAGTTGTQATSRTTAIALSASKPTGSLTLFTAAPTLNTPVTFAVTNVACAATDVIMVSVKSATNTYTTAVTATAANTFSVTITSVVGTASDTPVLNFAVIKGVTS